MTNTEEQYLKVDGALSDWRQGDVAFPGMDFAYWANLGAPITETAKELAKEEKIPAGSFEPVIAFSEVVGFVVLTQTCDIVRESAGRPYIEMAPLVGVSNEELQSIRTQKRPRFAFIPRMASKNLVADLDRVMTLEKSVVATWDRIPGWGTDEEIRAFSEALARKRARFAFPDEFVARAGKLCDYFKKQYKRSEGSDGFCLRNIKEIRLRAAPSWDSNEVKITFWFIKDGNRLDSISDLSEIVDKWMILFDTAGKFKLEAALIVKLEDMKARDYLESDRLDFDHLSIPF
jgi:hypothetical protein